MSATWAPRADAREPLPAWAHVALNRIREKMRSPASEHAALVQLGRKLPAHRAFLNLKAHAKLVEWQSHAIEWERLHRRAMSSRPPSDAW